VAYGMKDNPNYKVLIAGGGKKIKAYVPETFQLSVNGNFGPAFGQGIADSTLGNFSKLFGLGALTSQSMSAQVWMGSSPVEMSLELEFIASDSPTLQVMNPVKDLMSITMPSRGAGGFLLDPPGPSYVDIQNWQIGDGKSIGNPGRKISVKIGNFLLFDNVVIENVNTTYHSMMHSSGIPLRATCAVQFKTFFIQLKEDLPKIFMLDEGE
jgi:hypothetical protein